MVSTRRSGVTRSGCRYSTLYFSDRRADEALVLHPPPPPPNDRRSRAVNVSPCSQSSRFERIAFGSGAFFFLALLKFPVIRIQPGFRRVGISGAISYGIYSYIGSIASEMKIKRSTSDDTKSRLRTASSWWVSRGTTGSPSDHLPSNQPISALYPI